MKYHSLAGHYSGTTRKEDNRNKTLKIRSINWRTLPNLPVYPIAASFILPLTTYENNLDIISGGSTLVRPLIATGLVAIVGTGVLGVLLRSRHRGGLVMVFFLILLFFGDGAARRAVNFLGSVVDIHIAPEYPLAAMFVFAVIISLLVKIGPAFTRALNAGAVAVIAYHVIFISYIGLTDNIGPSKSDGGVFKGASVAASSIKPDIYHIVLDGYSGADVLSEFYGVDNSPFLDQLRNLGFAVVGNARTPYNKTQLVVLSVLEGLYLDQLNTVPVNDNKRYSRQLKRRYNANSVFSQLSKMGYSIVATHTEYPPLALGAYKTLEPKSSLGLTFLERNVLHRTAFSLVLDAFDSSGVGESRSARVIRETYDATLTAELESPTFVFIHQLAPHPPFDVTRDGDWRETVRRASRLADASDFHLDKPELKEKYKLGYVEKLFFLNYETIKYLKRLIAERPDPKVIIVHGDHGGGLNVDHGNLALTCTKERFTPLLAVYSSDHRLQQHFEEQFNLVNIYRVVFNTYFNTELILLNNKSYFTSYSQSFKHRLITTKDWTSACPSND